MKMTFNSLTEEQQFSCTYISQCELTVVIFHMCVQVVTPASFVMAKLALKGFLFAMSSLIVHRQLVLVWQNFGTFLTADFQVFSMSSPFFICHPANFLVLQNSSNFDSTFWAGHIFSFKSTMYPFHVTFHVENRLKTLFTIGFLLCVGQYVRFQDVDVREQFRANVTSDVFIMHFHVNS